MTRFRFALLTVLAMILALLGAAAIAGAPAQARAAVDKAAARHVADDVREAGTDLNDGKALPFSAQTKAAARARTLRQALRTPSAVPPADPTVGSVKTWLSADDYNGVDVAEDYTLRGIGNHIQVWVANDTAFPAGDCRNDLDMSDVTDAQVNSFVHEYDTNILPKESSAFSVAAPRDGEGGADLAGELGYPADYWQVSAAQADDVVVLVSNVRDANFYAPNTPDGQTYIAGFFASYYNDAFDRNIMTIDTFDWLHRTGSNPPDDSANPAYQACSEEIGRPGLGGAKPNVYEGTFAHEYQHLLESYVDPAEYDWVNEGLSMYAEVLTGYTNPNVALDKPDAPSEISIFGGYYLPGFGGPENSLTSWGDQGGPEILSDYGAAQAFMVYLSSRFGPGIISALHKNPGQGLAGLDAVLKKTKGGVPAQQVLHDWSAMMALDGVSGANGPIASAPGRFRSNKLVSTIQWDNPESYDSPGAPPNGSDYVRLRDAQGHYLTSTKQLKTLTFDGAKTLDPIPLEWTVDATPPDDTSAISCGDTGAGSGPAALYSGCGDSIDRSLVRQATVPATGATFTFDALWSTEQDYDYVYPIVSADGGKTWNDLTTADTAPEGGFNGDSGGWHSETASLAPYAGKSVLIGFEYVTDSGVSLPGFWVRNVKVGATAVPAGLAGWKTITQFSPVKVAGYTVQLVSYTAKNTAWWTKLTISGTGATFHAAMTGAQRGALGSGTTIAAIVTYDDPTESVTQEAPYTLKVNGVVQPGG